MAREDRRRDDEADDQPAAKKEGGRSWLFWLGLAAGVLVVINCLCGGAGVIVLMTRDNSATAEKLPGRWRGTFVFGGNRIESVYVFNQNGTFREEMLDPATGAVVRVSDGRWTLRNGTVNINWNTGTFERGTVRWIDDNNIDYRITDHTERIQIGVSTMMRRQ